MQWSHRKGKACIVTVEFSEENKAKMPALETDVIAVVPSGLRRGDTDKV